MTCFECSKTETAPDNWIVARSTNHRSTLIAAICSPPCAAKYFVEKFPESELEEEGEA